jgi:hypothetical protein
MLPENEILVFQTRKRPQSKIKAKGSWIQGYMKTSSCVARPNAGYQLERVERLRRNDRQSGG